MFVFDNPYQIIKKYSAVASNAKVLMKLIVLEAKIKARVGFLGALGRMCEPCHPVCYINIYK